MSRYAGKSRMLTGADTRPNKTYAVAYVRVSTEEQARFGVSLDAQVERVTSYAQLMGLELVAVLREEGVSAAKPLSDRPEGSKLLGMVERGEVQHVVAMKLDRLFRSAIDCLHNVARWDGANVAVHFVDLGGQSFNTRTALGRMFLTMTAAFAELERNLIAERTRGAMAHKKEQRRKYGHIPYGFVEQAGQLVADVREAEVVGRVQALYDAGWGTRRIAALLNAEGVPSKKGGIWYPSTVQKILTNTLHQQQNEVA